MTPVHSDKIQWRKPIGIISTILRTATTVLIVAAVSGLISPSLATADSGASNDATYTASTTAIDIGSGWHVTVGQLSGGNSAVATAFNSASLASGRTMAAMLDAQNVVRTDADFRTQAAVSFRPTTVSQVLTGVYYWQHAAHPLDFVTTIVIDSRTARPITLEDLFTDMQAGLNRLSAQTKVLLPAAYGRGSAPDGELAGNAPVVRNFHHWTPTEKGLEIHFEDYQFAHGLPVITVPWSELADVLAPGMQILSQ